MSPGNKLPEERRDSAEGAVIWEGDRGEDTDRRQMGKPSNLKEMDTSCRHGVTMRSCKSVFSFFSCHRKSEFQVT